MGMVESECDMIQILSCFDLVFTVDVRSFQLNLPEKMTSLQMLRSVIVG